jgi:hypothetical protein
MDVDGRRRRVRVWEEALREELGDFGRGDSIRDLSKISTDL